VPLHVPVRRTDALLTEAAGRRAADHPARAIAWFTRDLRLDDNPALAAAIRAADQVLPVFVWDPAILDGGRMAERRTNLMRDALASLDRALRERGGRLIVRRGEPADVLAGLARETGATEVHAARDTTPFARARFARVAAAVPRLALHAGTLLVEPEAVGAWKVFSAFHRHWTQVPVAAPIAAPREFHVPHDVHGEDVAPTTPDSDPHADVLARLRAVARGAAARYARDRGRLDLDGSSRLSAALHLGLISVRRVFAAVDDEAFRRELAWRDWASHLLWFRPDALRSGWGEELRDIPWRRSDADLEAWQQGRTGYPTVDAAMRQLAEDGWLNNRARMIVASFLAKDLLLDWRLGERWFLRRLIDGDIANNSLGWQWTAGVGTDAAPYFRVLNPSLQGERFDPDGTWVKRWLPELADLDPRWIHRPWAAPEGVRPSARQYPSPMVDHAEARRRAIAAFGSARRG
jgi:deoxyribodipyrimidine photo-lyase